MIEFVLDLDLNADQYAKVLAKIPELLDDRETVSSSSDTDLMAVRSYVNERIKHELSSIKEIEDNVNETKEMVEKDIQSMADRLRGMKEAHDHLKKKVKMMENGQVKPSFVVPSSPSRLLPTPEIEIEDIEDVDNLTDAVVVSLRNLLKRGRTVAISVEEVVDKTRMDYPIFANMTSVDDLTRKIVRATAWKFSKQYRYEKTKLIPHRHSDGRKVPSRSQIKSAYHESRKKGVKKGPKRKVTTQV